jgi:hypothetical protein
LDAEILFRERGFIPTFTIGQYDRVFDDQPICFQGKANFRSEEEKRAVDPEENCRKAVQHERYCEAFTPWRLGFTPKEHWEMIQETERLKYQAECDAANVAERERRDMDARDFQRDQAALARRHQNRTLVVSIAAVGIAVAGLIANTMIGLSKKPQPINITVQPPAQQVQETSPAP